MLLHNKNIDAQTFGEDHGEEGGFQSRWLLGAQCAELESMANSLPAGICCAQIAINKQIRADAKVSKVSKVSKGIFKLTKL